MASGFTKTSAARGASNALSTPQLTSDRASVERIDHPLSANLDDSLPCVLYECSLSFEIVYMSPNTADILGVEAQSFVGTRRFWNERLLPSDSALLRAKMNQLEETGSDSTLHRVIDDRGLPQWVCHGFRRVLTPHGPLIRGCMVRLGNENIYDVEQGDIGRFIHKLGNHFQLLNLVVNSLKKTSRQARETEILEQTIENAIDLTRTFSEYCQSPNCTPIVDFAEIVNAAAMTRNQSFLEKQVIFHRMIDEASLKGVLVRGDACQLELSLGHVLENALEATAAGGTVVLHAMAEIAAHDRAVVRLRVVDSGAGIEIEKMDRINLPFYTTKMNHNGLGLSMAVRFVEVHGGLLTVKSGEGQGTEVTITLPAVTSEQVSEPLRL